MAQETRRDPRAKVLTMTVRYKSATVDEFIEHHSHDVSRGGMFIKTPSPFPPGTLLKFEIKISDDRPVLQGVGRVVWKRETAQASSDSPAGMGVKFIKIDDASKSVIDRLVTSRGANAGPSAYESDPAAFEKEPSKQADVLARKGTMMGLGAMVPQNLTAPGRPITTPPPTGGGFFPTSATPPAQRPPEERTVMKQAAELLQEALRDAGGSMAEIAENPLFEQPAKAPAITPAAGSPPPAVRQPANKTMPLVAVHVPAAHEPAPAVADALPAAVVATSTAALPNVATPARAISEPPPARLSPAAVAASQPVRAEPAADAPVRRPRTLPPPVETAPPSSGGRVVLYAGVVAVLAAGVWFVTHNLLGNTEATSVTPTPMVTAPVTPSATASDTASASASAMATASAPSVASALSARPGASAAPSASASSKGSPAAPTTRATAAPVRTSPPELPKPATTDTAKPAGTDTAKPSTTTTATTATSTTTPTAAPTTKPKTGDDNPY